MASVCSKRCRKCKYAYGMGMSEGYIICDYLLTTKERRGCPAGDECTRFEKGKKARVRCTIS